MLLAKNLLSCYLHVGVGQERQPAEGLGALHEFWAYFGWAGAGQGWQKAAFRSTHPCVRVLLQRGVEMFLISTGGLHSLPNLCSNFPAWFPTSGEAKANSLLKRSSPPAQNITLLDTLCSNSSFHALGFFSKSLQAGEHAGSNVGADGSGSPALASLRCSVLACPNVFLGHEKWVKPCTLGNLCVFPTLGVLMRVAGLWIHSDSLLARHSTINKACLSPSRNPVLSFL